MRIMVINSSTSFSAVSVGDKFELIGSRLTLNQNQKSNSEDLPPMIESLIHHLPIDCHPIDAVAVVVGPSSYTALRLGITAAKMLSIAWNVPIISIRTSFIYSYFASRKKQSLSARVVLNTGRQKFWLESYHKDNPFSINSQAKLYDREELLSVLSHDEFAIIGDCLSTLQEDCDLASKIHPKSMIIQPPRLEEMTELQYYAALSLWLNKTKHSHVLSQSEGDRLTPIYFGDIK